MVTHNWHDVPSDLRLGQSPDEVLTLYRGFEPHQFDPERGMLSSDALTGNEAAIARVVQAINEGDDEYLVRQLMNHTQNGYAEQHGLTTPFVSVTPEQRRMGFYASRPGARVATLAIRANRVIWAPFFAGEVVVLGRIGLEEIVKIEESTKA